MKKLYLSILMILSSFTSVNMDNYKYKIISDADYNMSSVYGSFVEFQESKYDSDKKTWSYRRKDVVEDIENRSLTTLESILKHN
jgi:hypothetical protein